MYLIKCQIISHKDLANFFFLKLLFSRVYCDGCNKSFIIKTRFECTECHNFDLCLDCHQKEIFPERYQQIKKLSKHFVSLIPPKVDYSTGFTDMYLPSLNESFQNSQSESDK